MANSFGSIQDTHVAQKVLGSFSKRLAPVSSFATDFSDVAAQPGDTVKVSLETYPNDAVATKTSGGAYTIQDADATVISLSLGEPVYTSYGLTDVEKASSSALNMERFSNSKANHLATGVLQGILGDVTAANYSGVSTVAAASFDLDAVADLKDLLDDNEAPEEGRSLVLSNAYVTNLLKDGSINNNFNGTQGEFRQGVIGQLFGFDVIPCNQIPGNSENLVGFACVPEAMACAMRYNMPQDGHTYSIAEPLADPSGITLGIRQWYSNDTGVNNRVLECIYDSAPGNTDGLIRIASA